MEAVTLRSPILQVYLAGGSGPTFVNNGNAGGNGGGGAAGTRGNGGNGANPASGSPAGGSGGGGSGGGASGTNGAAGAAATTNTAGAGGNNSAGAGSGAASGTGTGAGTAGTVGGGGGGGGWTAGTGGNGGAGGPGADWTSNPGGATAGAGGGGGGGGNSNTATAGGGGLYGGGGAGSGDNANTTAGAGAQGIIVITYTPSTAGPNIQGDWPLPKTYARPDATYIWYSERLVNLPNPLPKNQYDWPNPKTWPRPDENYTWFSERLVNLPNPLPKNQYDWPNPRAYPPGTSYVYFSEQLVNQPNPVPKNQFDWPNPLRTIWYQTWSEAGNVQLPFPTPFVPLDQTNIRANTWYRDWSQNLLQTTLVVTGTPFSQGDWPLPRTYPLPGQTWILNLQETTLAPTLMPLPPIWSVSSTVAPIDQTWIQNLVNSTLSFTAVLPFSQTDWPNAQRITWDRFWSQSPAQPVPQTPFFQSDWPLPRSYPLPGQTWTVNLQENTLAPAFFNLPPVWSITSNPVPIVQTWVQNLLETTLSSTPRPFSQTIFSSFFFSSRNDYSQYYTSPLSLLIPPGIPFNQTDWKNPYPVYWYRDHNQNLVIYIPTGAVPFSQTDWPLTRSPQPLDQFYYQALVLNLPIPPTPPAIISSGRQISLEEAASEVAQWLKKQESASMITGAEWGKIGPPKGGVARAKALTPQQRSTIATLGAHTRWQSPRK